MSEFTRCHGPARTPRFALVLSTLALASLPTHAYAELDVVATLPSLAAIAQAVGGEHVEVSSLALPSEDPHYVDPRPDYVLALNQADLLVLNGMELEIGWLPTLQTGARNSSINVGGDGYFDASAFIDPLEVPTSKIERSQGDIHPQGNPHYLFDPECAARVAAALGERLAALDPSHEDDYLANADKFVSELEKVRREQAARFAKLDASKRKVVVYHASMVYLVSWLGLEQVATIEPKPGVSPDPGHVAAVLKAMKASSVKAIIQESFYPTETSKKLAELAGAELVVLSGGANFAKDEPYLEHLVAFTDALYGALD